MGSVRTDGASQYLSSAFERFGPQLYETMPSRLDMQYEQILISLMDRFTRIILKKIGDEYVLHIYRGNKIQHEVRNESFDRLMFDAARYMGV
ncbi:hypothetical protein X275_01225 [Marinitoga sp. 1197]|uniref:hypothetical protein n=1 Tax=Marinitoga sp. 1197 TaxID=1428449 RepID=UPI0006412875|nr:hypothetical protein [Marinitoga sp. 1197]AJW76894.1 hypothetical protein UF08_5 [Marinitoga camini virus 1]KLO24042.1 hypothetical protein X275_01225 [Marinitoga sp. 1197]